VPNVNHHSVNTSSDDYAGLQKYFTQCIATSSSETLDLSMEGTFVWEEDRSAYKVPFDMAFYDGSDVVKGTG
jgi:hypothetical protein